MMLHLEDGTLQALVDDELSAPEEREARRHLATCEVCTGRLAEVRGAAFALSGALSLIDVPARPGRPPVLPASTAAREPDGVLPFRSVRPERSARPTPSAARWRPAAVRRAAAILLFVAAGASATVPGSPIREWFETRFAPEARPVVESAPEVATAVEPAPEMGVSVAPADGRLQIVLNGAGPDLRVVAVMTSAARGGVFAEGGADEARFRTAAGLIEVEGAADGALRVEIPADADAVSLVVDGVSQLVKDGDRLRLTPAGERAGLVAIEATP